MKNKVIYPGTFDPITCGHIDLVKRASRIFDEVVIAISDNPKKAPLFSLSERIELAKAVFQDHDQVVVKGFSGLLTEFAKEENSKVILRGLRVVSDFDYEFQMASMNRMLDHALETVFLTPGDRYTYISSSLVKEIAASGGDVSHFVPGVVQQALLSVGPQR